MKEEKMYKGHLADRWTRAGVLKRRKRQASAKIREENYRTPEEQLKYLDKMKYVAEKERKKLRFLVERPSSKKKKKDKRQKK